jgi:hypothetical protein
MKRCIEDAELKAFVDLELSEAKRSEITGHVERCDGCRSRLQDVVSLTKEIRADLDVIAPANGEDVAMPGEIHIPAGATWADFDWRRAAAIAFVAAVALSGTLVAHYRTPALGISENSVTNLPVAGVSATSQTMLTIEVLPEPGNRLTSSGPKKLMTFVRLDNGEPIESGRVMRVKFPAAMFSNVNPSKTPQVEADAIVDEQGRVRGIRVLGPNL